MKKIHITCQECETVLVVDSDRLWQNFDCPACAATASFRETPKTEDEEIPCVTLADLDSVVNGCRLLAALGILEEILDNAENEGALEEITARVTSSNIQAINPTLIKRYSPLLAPFLLKHSRALIADAIPAFQHRLREETAILNLNSFDHLFPDAE